ncbi:DUF1707 domain-containing protein [Nocardioides sp.]|uniref:DUF1707 SHOCT-like domain-containing protein n=1 Tax=Nocardioides sp. TaxID=35761 RepID=UPI002F418223
MTTGNNGSLWGRFEHDPRDPAYAGVRASDRDRAVVHDALSSAYAEGRLDREELDERTAAVDAAKTYGALLPPLLDLAADAGLPAVSLSSRPDLQRQAQGYYQEKRGEAIMGFLIPNLIVWAIWLFAGHGFPWPVFVLIPTAGNLVRVLSSKQSIIDGRIEKLERKQAKALEPPKPPKPSKSGEKHDDGRILRENQDKPEQA